MFKVDSHVAHTVDGLQSLFNARRTSNTDQAINRNNNGLGLSACRGRLITAISGGFHRIAPAPKERQDYEHRDSRSRHVIVT